MKALQNYLRRTTPERATIPWKAHAATVAACALIVPSVVAVFIRRAGIREDEPYWVWASETLWGLHAVVVAIAVLLWLFEKPRSTEFLPVRDDATSGALRRIHPALPLAGFAAIGLLFGWVTVSRIGDAYAQWRVGAPPGRIVGQVLGILPPLVLTLTVAFWPGVVLYLWLRKSPRRRRMAGKPL